MVLLISSALPSYLPSSTPSTLVSFGSMYLARLQWSDTFITTRGCTITRKVFEDLWVVWWDYELICSITICILFCAKFINHFCKLN